MWSTLLVTHKHQSKVPVQRLNTRDELGFERRWCCWRCWWRLPTPRWESCWWWWWRWFPPPGGKFPRRNRSDGGQKCSYPSSASRGRRSVPKVLSLFFLGQNELYTRRWAPEVGLGEHNPPGRAWAPWRAQVRCAHLVGLLWYLFAPIFIINSIKILCEVSTCLELCRIGSLM